MRQIIEIETRKIENYLSIDSAWTFYFGLVQSIVSYGILIWGGTIINSSWSTKFLKLQDKIDFNLLAGPSKYEMSQIYLNCRILKFIDLYKINACTTIYKVLNDNYSNFYMSNYLEYSDSMNMTLVIDLIYYYHLEKKLFIPSNQMLK